MRTYKELIVWQRGTELVVNIYKLTQKFPKEELYGLSSQMRRAAVSIPSNIAEGFGRKSRGEFKQFLKIAFGSATELETQLIIAEKLKMVAISEYEKTNTMLIEVMKMLNKMISNLSTNS